MCRGGKQETVVGKSKCYGKNNAKRTIQLDDTFMTDVDGKKRRRRRRREG